jgi:AcrR family transcriptional regulator
MSAEGTARGEGRASPRKGELTRRRLLDAAESVFADVGYHDASIVRITESAGVAQGTFYIYFESKQQIFEEVVFDLNHRVRQAMTSASAGARNRLEAERQGFAAFFRFTAEHPGLYRVIRQAEFVSPKAMAEHYERIIAGYVPQLEAAMAAGEVVPTDPTVLAWALVAVGELAGMKWILWDDGRQMPPEVFEQVMAVVGRMLGSSGRKGQR